MKIPQGVVNTTAGLFTPAAIMFLHDAINGMIPWIITMFFVVIADLIAGVRKSLKLGIHVSVTMAFRETMGKLVTYTAFVLMVCMIDSASNHTMALAKWGCLFIALLEGISIISNILKPMGIDLSMKSFLKIFAKKVVDVDSEDAAELVGDDTTLQAIRERERERWERRKRHQYGAHKTEKDKDK
jgi:phage-related holin